MHWTNNRQDGARTTAILLGLCHDCHDLSARRTLTLSSVAVHPPKPPFASASLSPASSGYLLLHLDCPYTPCQPVLLLPSLTFIAQLATYTPSIIAKIWTSQNCLAWKTGIKCQRPAKPFWGSPVLPGIWVIWHFFQLSILPPKITHFL